MFTNLTQDHLDFHDDMEDYFAAKRALFAPDGRSAEDRGCQRRRSVRARLAAEMREPASRLTFSASGAEAPTSAPRTSPSTPRARASAASRPDGEVEVAMPLPGHFNVENALAAIAAASALGVPPERPPRAGERRRVPGRFEPIDEGQPFAVLVDYAHTPDSLENVLAAARRLTAGRLICVFGCGGDRDREKRPLMGEIAARLADACVVTSDNPRSEDPEAIIAEILAGSPAPRRRRSWWSPTAAPRSRSRSRPRRPATPS